MRTLLFVGFYALFIIAAFVDDGTGSLRAGPDGEITRGPSTCAALLIGLGLVSAGFAVHRRDDRLDRFIKDGINGLAKRLGL